MIIFLLCIFTFNSLIIQPTRVNGYDLCRHKFEFELLTLVGDDAGYIAGALIASYLGAVGMKINQIHQESAVMYPKLEDFGYYENASSHELGAEPWNTVRPYDLIYMPSPSSPSTPTDLSMLHSGEDYPGGKNEWGFHNATMDANIDFMFNISLDIVPLYLNRQQAICAEEVPYVHVIYQKDMMPIRKGIDGLVYTPHGVISWKNPLTPLNIHNTTNLPATRNGTEWVMRYFKFVIDGDPGGPLYYEISKNRSAFVDSLLWEPLVQTNETGGFIPWLAESYEISEDGMIYNFTLRDNIYWHDGTLMMPEDIVFSYNYINDAWDAGEAIYNPCADVTSCIILEDGIIQFMMEELDPWAIPNIFTELKIFPKHIFETVPYNDVTWHDLTNMTTKIGSGPYKFQEVSMWAPPTWWTFVRNPNYWFTGTNPHCITSLEPIYSEGGNNPSITQYPRMERFTIRVITDVDSTITALRNGEVDLCRYIWFDVANAAQEYPDEIKMNTIPSTWRKILWINNNVYPLSDKRVRQAIAYAIDYDAIVEASEGNKAIALYNNYLPIEYYGTWHNPASDVYDYNPARAYAILEDAGHLDTDGDGVREADSIHTPICGGDMTCSSTTGDYFSSTGYDSSYTTYPFSEDPDSTLFQNSTSTPDNTRARHLAIFDSGFFIFLICSITALAGGMALAYLYEKTRKLT